MSQEGTLKCQILDALLYKFNGVLLHSGDSSKYVLFSLFSGSIAASHYDLDAAERAILDISFCRQFCHSEPVLGRFLMSAINAASHYGCVAAE